MTNSASRQAVVERLIERDGTLCTYCGVEMLPYSERFSYSHYCMTIDHVVPKARGGGGNYIDNLVLACRACNGMKGDLTMADFIKRCRVIVARAEAGAF